MNYTPPEPHHSALAFVAHGSNQSPIESYFTEAQLRSEVDRVRRETIEECAKEAYHWYEINKSHRCGDYIAAAIRGLLK